MRKKTKRKYNKKTSVKKKSTTMELSDDDIDNMDDEVLKKEHDLLLKAEKKLGITFSEFSVVLGSPIILDNLATYSKNKSKSKRKVPIKTFTRITRSSSKVDFNKYQGAFVGPFDLEFLTSNNKNTRNENEVKEKPIKEQDVSTKVNSKLPEPVDKLQLDINKEHVQVESSKKLLPLNGTKVINESLVEIIGKETSLQLNLNCTTSNVPKDNSLAIKCAFMTEKEQHVYSLCDKNVAYHANEGLKLPKNLVQESQFYPPKEYKTTNICAPYSVSKGNDSIACVSNEVPNKEMSLSCKGVGPVFLNAESCFKNLRKVFSKSYNKKLSLSKKVKEHKQSEEKLSKRLKEVLQSDVTLITTLRTCYNKTRNYNEHYLNVSFKSNKLFGIHSLLKNNLKHSENWVLSLSLFKNYFSDSAIENIKFLCNNDKLQLKGIQIDDVAVDVHKKNKLNITNINNSLVPSVEQTKLKRKKLKRKYSSSNLALSNKRAKSQFQHDIEEIEEIFNKHKKEKLNVPYDGNDNVSVETSLTLNDSLSDIEVIFGETGVDNLSYEFNTDLLGDEASIDDLTDSVSEMSGIFENLSDKNITNEVVQGDEHLSDKIESSIENNASDNVIDNINNNNITSNEVIEIPSGDNTDIMNIDSFCFISSDESSSNSELIAEKQFNDVCDPKLEDKPTFSLDSVLEESYSLIQSILANGNSCSITIKELQTSSNEKEVGHDLMPQEVENGINLLNNQVEKIPLENNVGDTVDKIICDNSEHLISNILVNSGNELEIIADDTIVECLNNCLHEENKPDTINSFDSAPNSNCINTNNDFCHNSYVNQEDINNYFNEPNNEFQIEQNSDILIKSVETNVTDTNSVYMPYITNNNTATFNEVKNVPVFSLDSEATHYATYDSNNSIINFDPNLSCQGYSNEILYANSNDTDVIKSNTSDVSEHYLHKNQMNKNSTGSASNILDINTLTPSTNGDNDINNINIAVPLTVNDDFHRVVPQSTDSVENINPTNLLVDFGSNKFCTSYSPNPEVVYDTTTSVDTDNFYTNYSSNHQVVDDSTISSSNNFCTNNSSNHQVVDVTTTSTDNFCTNYSSNHQVVGDTTSYSIDNSCMNYTSNPQVLGDTTTCSTENFFTNYSSNPQVVDDTSTCYTDNFCVNYSTTTQVVGDITTCSTDNYCVKYTSNHQAVGDATTYSYNNFFTNCSNTHQIVNDPTTSSSNNFQMNYSNTHQVFNDPTTSTNNFQMNYSNTHQVVDVTTTSTDNIYTNYSNAYEVVNDPTTYPSNNFHTNYSTTTQVVDDPTTSSTNSFHMNYSNTHQVVGDTTPYSIDNSCTNFSSNPQVHDNTTTSSTDIDGVNNVVSVLVDTVKHDSFDYIIEDLIRNSEDIKEVEEMESNLNHQHYENVKNFEEETNLNLQQSKNIEKVIEVETTLNPEYYENMRNFEEKTNLNLQQSKNIEKVIEVETNLNPEQHEKVEYFEEEDDEEVEDKDEDEDEDEDEDKEEEEKEDKTSSNPQQSENMNGIKEMETNLNLHQNENVKNVEGETSSNSKQPENVDKDKELNKLIVRTQICYL